MKKPVLFAIAALALLASCAKTEVVPVQNDGDQLISFQTAVSRQGTRALINDPVYPTDETFGTFAFFNAKNTAFPTGAELYIPESKVKHDNSNGANRWLTEIPYYWPKQGSLTFFSYSPYDKLKDVTDCDVTDGIQISSWDVDANQTVDVLVADVKKNETKNYKGTSSSYDNGVPTIFRHKLAQIVNVTFKTDAEYHGDRTEATAQQGDKFFYMNSFKINNIQYKGSYKSTVDVDETHPGAWTPDADVESYEWYVNANNEENVNGFDKNGTSYDATAKLSRDYLLILPQAFAEPADLTSLANEKTVDITYTIRTCVKVNGTTPVFSDEKVELTIPLWQIQGGAKAGQSSTAVAAKSWEMNKKYSYTFTIGLDQILWDPAVEIWVGNADTTFEHTIE